MIRKVVYGHNIFMLLILIRQMAAQVRRALAEVCTVPVLILVLVSACEDGKQKSITPVMRSSANEKDIIRSMRTNAHQ